MASLNPQPILVTGAHRTGTTWVGRLLAAPAEVAYISEPLNVLHRQGVLRATVANWYTYICDENSLEFVDAFRDLLAFRYHLVDELKSLRSFHDLGRMARDIGVFIGGRTGQRVPLLKDPFAVFSLRWFAGTLGCRTVVTTRHPAAFASGLKRLGWSFDFGDLLRQPLLMRDHLGPFRSQMASASPNDIVGQAALLWSMIYGTLQRLQAEVPNVKVVRHEDLARDPVGGFKDLYRHLGLIFTPQVERVIRDSSKPGNPAELSRRATHAVKMDSAASLQNWKRRLSPDEVARVRRLTQGVAEAYFPVESWN